MDPNLKPIPRSAKTTQRIRNSDSFIESGTIVQIEILEGCKYANVEGPGKAGYYGFEGIVQIDGAPLKFLDILK